VISQLYMLDLLDPGATCLVTTAMPTGSLVAVSA
jgi:hypothetical protein